MIKYLSYSALSTYQQCPLKFKFEYIDYLGEIYRQERPYLSFGNSLHSTLAKFFQIKDTKQRTLDSLYSLLKKNWISKGYSSIEEETEYRQLAFSILEHFYETADLTIQPLYIEEFFKLPIKDFFLTGKIDRIDPLPEGGIEIIDYKTGKFLPTQEEIKDDFQLRIYALASLKKYGLLPKKVSIYCLERNIKFSTEFQEEKINKTLEEIIQLYDRISQDKTFQPVKNHFCPACDYLVICPLMGLGVKPAERQKLKEDYQSTIKYLEEIRNELYNLYKGCIEISSTLDRTALMKKSLDIMLKLNDIEKGVFLYKDDDKFKIGYSVGSIYIKDDFHLNLHRISSEPIIVNDIQNKLEYLQLFENPLDIRNLIILPLIIDKKEEKEVLGIVLLANHKDGSDFDNHDAVLLGSISAQIAISLYNATLYELAVTDGLTKLYLHRYFQQRLDQELSRSKRYKSSLSLLMIDIDHFKKLNDTYGHPEGDKILKILAKIFKDSFRETDIIARYGGEEFACILIETGQSGAKETAERLRRTVENYPFNIKGNPIKLTISVGVDTWDFVTSKEEFIEHADRALYAAKNFGRNRVVTYDELKKDNQFFYF
ncbi:MAG: diguanylate cyclase [Endomicrobiia bacterium]